MPVEAKLQKRPRRHIRVAANHRSNQSGRPICRCSDANCSRRIGPGRVSIRIPPRRTLTFRKRAGTSTVAIGQRHHRADTRNSHQTPANIIVSR
jgi:hypothetical protein